MDQLIRLLPVLLLISACAGDSDGTTGDDDDTSDTEAPTGSTGTTSTAETGTVASCFDDPPAVAVGTGESAFAEVADAGPVELVFGSQGGYHMVSTIRVCHMQLSPPLTVRLRQVDELSGAVILDVTLPTPLFADGDCCGWRSMGALQLDNNAIPGAPAVSGEFGDWMDGRIVVFTMDAEDSLGATASGSVRVTAAYEP